MEAPDELNVEGPECLLSVWALFADKLKLTLVKLGAVGVTLCAAEAGKLDACKVLNALPEAENTGVLEERKERRGT